jgi:hypothetical protein
MNSDTRAAKRQRRQIDEMEKQAGSSGVERSVITRVSEYITKRQARPQPPRTGFGTGRVSAAVSLVAIAMLLLATYALASAYWMAGLEAAVPRQVQTSSPTVTLKNGSYAGVHSPEFRQEFFLGMPYAEVCYPKIGLGYVCANPGAEGRALHTSQAPESRVA